MTKELTVHIGGSFNDMAKRVSEAWKLSGQGAAVAKGHLTFVNWEAFSSMMTTERLDLLRHLHHQPEANIAALAKSLRRSYREVHEDVELLDRAGLLELDDAGLRTSYDEIRTVIAL